MISHHRRDEHPLRDDVEDLQRTSLIWISLAAGATGFVFLCISGGSPAVGRPMLWLVISVLAVVLGSVWLLLGRLYNLAAVVASVGLVAVLVVAAAVYSSRDVLFGIPLIIFVVPVLLDYRVTVEIAFISWVAVWLLRITTSIPLSSGDVLAVSALTAGSVVLGWIAYRPT